MLLHRIVVNCIAGLLAIASATAAESPAPARPLADPGFSLDHMDLSVPPGTDFAKFAAGGWYARTEIPPDKSRWGGFDELAERNWAKIHAILREVSAASAAPGSVRQKVGDFFTSGMDTAALNRLGLTPVEPALAAIVAAPNPDELVNVVAAMHLRIGAPFLNTSFGADQKQSDRYGFYMMQGGMSLPSKEYYFSDKFARERWEFVGHVAKVFELAGEAKATAFRNAETVFAIERSLAENAKLPVDLRDRLANYNKMTIEEAAEAFSGFPLKQFVAQLGVPAGTTDVIIGQPQFFEGLSKLWQERPLDDLKTYTRWQMLRSASPLLSEEFEKESFRFFRTVLNGTPEQEPRWQRVARVIDGSIGEGLGEIYVERHFPPASKARVMEMIGNIRAVMRQRLETIEWMSKETRQKALAKFDRFSPMIGYPEKWRDYSKVEVKAGDYFGNVSRASLAEMRREIDRVGQRVDRDEWHMTPQTVNAYFSPTTNQIVFPAGILQPPFFDAELDDAVNYGAIGAVIGHEITHGFDDQGRRYDAAGNLTDWWTPEDAARFRERAQKLVEQFNNYFALPDLAVNGQLSLGENIADLGGTSISFEAFQRSLRGKPEPAKIDGFTAEQRFFISWAQQWRTKYRDDAMRLQVSRGPHAPGNFRAIGPLVNLPAFYAAFGVTKADPMWRDPEQRAKIW